MKEFYRQFIGCWFAVSFKNLPKSLISEKVFSYHHHAMYSSIIHTASVGGEINKSSNEDKKLYEDLMHRMKTTSSAYVEKSSITKSKDMQLWVRPK